MVVVVWCRAGIAVVDGCQKGSGCGGGGGGNSLLEEEEEEEEEEEVLLLLLLLLPFKVSFFIKGGPKSNNLLALRICSSLILIVTPFPTLVNIPLETGGMYSSESEL